MDPTKINYNTEIKGELVSDNDIRLDGHLEGKLISKKKIVIGKKGFFSGELECENLIVEGNLQGEATVGNTTSILAYSSFSGTLKTLKFYVEEGASFEGVCNTTSENKPPKLNGIDPKTMEKTNQSFDESKTLKTNGSVNTVV